MKQINYPIYQQKSGWNKLLPTRSATKPLVKDIMVDMTVIGAGYTGISAVNRWSELAPNDKTIIIDADEIGEGNPGRNSGFLLEIALADDADSREIERMEKTNYLIGKTIKKIKNSIQSTHIDCNMKRTGTYRAAAGSYGIKSLEKYTAFLRKARLPYEKLDRLELKKRLGTEFYKKGIYSPHCYLVQPAALIRALAGKLSNTVQLYENTPATNLYRKKDKWLIETPFANIISTKIILANNAFSKALGVGKSQLVAIYTYAGITKALDYSEIKTLGSEKNWGLLPTHRLGSTLRCMPDGKFLIRSFYDYENESDNMIIEKKLKKNLIKRFPQLMNIEFESVWSGATGFTWNGSPVWGEVKPNLYISSGCNGGGVVKGTLFGELIANLANGEKVTEVKQLFGEASWMPPEPFRKFGFHIISKIENYRAHNEI